MSLQVEVLEQSFEHVKPHADEFAASFYHNLLTDYPQLQPLFAKTDMEQQHQKLIMSLVLVIGNLRNPDYLKITLKNLGERHVSYGTLQQHYPMVGAALLKTFESYLGADWTPEVKHAWIDAYGVLADMMLEGAQSSANAIASSNPLQLNTDAASIQVSTSAPTSVSNQNYSQVNYQPKNEPQPYIQPVESSDPISAPATASGLNLKLILPLIVIFSLLGLGFFYYSNSKPNNNSSERSVARITF